MSARRILVKVSPIGDITVEADGFHGKGCEAATKAIEEALGRPRERVRKPEYRHRPATLVIRQKLGNGSC